MSPSMIRNGASRDKTTIVLDAPLPVASGRVEVILTLKSDVALPKQSLQEFLRDLRARQAERGHTPMTAEEIEAHIRAERASWGD